MANQLATIQKVIEIMPHNNADALEIAKVLGWEVIVKKGEFKAGDHCIYVQVDSVLPEKPEFEFLRERKYRVKTIKLRGVYSQGICFHCSLLPGNVNISEGLEVTEILGVKKYEKETPVNTNGPKKGKLANLYSYLRWKVLGWFGYKMPNGSFPTDIVSKTDEDRIQSYPSLLNRFTGQEYYATIKHDGTSVTFINGKKKLRVCSRNLELQEDTSVYWNMAKKYKLRNIPVGQVVQAEIVGPGIQGNKEGLTEHEIRVFNVYKDGAAFSFDALVCFCQNNNLTMADIYSTGVFGFSDVKAVMQEAGKAKYKNGALAEGLVFRLKSPVDCKYVSFKAVNPEYCLKNDE